MRKAARWSTARAAAPRDNSAKRDGAGAAGLRLKRKRMGGRRVPHDLGGAAKQPALDVPVRTLLAFEAP